MRSAKTPLRLEKIGRGFVQGGFLLLFLYPLVVVLYRKITHNPTPTLTSWLLWWDPTLAVGQLAQGNLAGWVIGGPALLLALSLVFGRFFCGWICPMGTLLDLVRPLFFWQRKNTLRSEKGVFPRNQNSPVRYILLAAALVTAIFSMKLLGVLNPLVIFHRSSTTLALNLFSARQPGIQAVISVISITFLLILVLEAWQPRFWCRNLCPTGAMLSLVSRFSLLKRFVSADCSQCARCQVDCPMNAIHDRGADTDYSQCTFCMECDSVCPQRGITFGFRSPHPEPQPLEPLPAAQPAAGINRRRFLEITGVSALGLALVPLAQIAPARPVLRPPGALPEPEFLKTCILCQECIRVCPTGGLRPAFLEGGLASMGTPILVPRQGGCALNPSCPDLCASACPVGAILPVTKDVMKIGIARVDHAACLAWDQSAKCLVCVEACLNSAAIIYHGRVTIDPNRCTGCGRCESGCPVPGSAIRVEVRAEETQRASG